MNSIKPSIIITDNDEENLKDQVIIAESIVINPVQKDEDANTWNEPPMWVQQGESPSHANEEKFPRRNSAKRRSFDFTHGRPQSGTRRNSSNVIGKDDLEQKKKKSILQIQESSNQVEASPDSGLRQIFRSSSPSLMKELSRLIGERDDIYHTGNDTPSPRSPHSPRVTYSGHPLNQLSPRDNLERPTTSRFRSFTSSINSPRDNIQDIQKDRKLQLYMNLEDLPAAEEIYSARTPRSARGTKSARNSISEPITQGRTTSPSKIINPEAILNRDPVLLSSRPKSTYLLDQMIREKNSQDPYRRASESLSNDKSIGPIISIPYPAQRRSSNIGSPIVETTKFKESDILDISSVHSIMKAVNSSNLDFSIPQRSDKRERINSSRSYSGRSARPRSSIIGKVENRNRLSVSSQSHTRRKSIGPKIFPGYFQQISQRIPNPAIKEIDMPTIRYIQTAQPRNQFSVRNKPNTYSEEGSSNVVYESRGAGFLSARSTGSKWASYEKAKEIRLKSPSTNHREYPNSARRDSSIKNILQIQSFSFTRSKQQENELNNSNIEDEKEEIESQELYVTASQKALSPKNDKGILNEDSNSFRRTKKSARKIPLSSRRRSSTTNQESDNSSLQESLKRKTKPSKKIQSSKAIDLQNTINPQSVEAPIDDSNNNISNDRLQLPPSEYHNVKVVENDDSLNNIDQVEGANIKKERATLSDALKTTNKILATRSNAQRSF